MTPLFQLQTPEAAQQGPMSPVDLGGLTYIRASKQKDRLGSRWAEKEMAGRHDIGEQVSASEKQTRRSLLK